MKMWAGRFAKETDKTVNDFNSSIPFDSRLYPYDIQGSIAHSQMLSDQGIISEEDKEKIHKGLQEILQSMDAGEVEFTTQYEDIHMCVEQLLTEKIGDAGKRLHTGRSRNDQVALDVRLYAQDQAQQILKALLHLIEVLTGIAKENTTTIMPGYTHLQRAQPITFGHLLMAYTNMFRRDVIRIENTIELMNECPLGSGALATTTYPIDREQTAKLLGYAKPCDNSLDGVSDRDYVVELLSDLSILMMHCSRLSEEVIAWCSWEFKFVELSDAYATGSSIMPQKKNPDICELVRGKTGRVFGDLQSILVTLKGIPLAYNKDMQEDKEALFDAVDTVKMCLEVLPPMFETMSLYKENMLKAAQKGFLNATDCADYLTKKGIPFRDAYKISGTIVAWCVENNKTLNEMSLEQYQKFHPLFENDIYEALDLMNCVESRKVYGGPSKDSVEKQIRSMESFVGSRKEMYEEA